VAVTVIQLVTFVAEHSRADEENDEDEMRVTEVFKDDDDSMPNGEE
jgi:hypothetical protein